MPCGSPKRILSALLELLDLGEPSLRRSALHPTLSLGLRIHTFRCGGVLVNASLDSVDTILERLRANIESTPLTILESSQILTINMTVSIGACTKLQSNLDTMTIAADKNLYTAKQEGRNRVVM